MACAARQLWAALHVRPQMLLAGCSHCACLMALPSCRTPPRRSELLLFLLPLVDVGAIKHALRSVLPRLPVLTGGGGAAAAGAGDGACGICGAGDILAPYAAQPCGHPFCYYCLRSHCAADPRYSCPLCLRRVEGMRRLGAADVDSSGDSGGDSSGCDNGGSRDASG